MYHVKAGVSVKLISIIIMTFGYGTIQKKFLANTLAFGDYNLVNNTLALDTK